MSESTPVGLALAGYAQVLLVPGLVVFALAGKAATLASLPRIVAISLLVNWLLANVLVLGGLWSRHAWLALLLIGLALIAVRPPKLDLTLRLPAILILVLSLLFLHAHFADAFLSVFTGHDAVFSWNRWANDWYRGALPEFTMIYPQLIPANWAAIYAVNGAPLEILARTIMPLFALLTALAFLRTNESRLVQVVGAVLCVFLVDTYFSRWLSTGYVDVAVMFMSWSALSIGYSLDSQRSIRSQRTEMVLASMLAAAASLTKQPGWLAVCFLQTIYFAGFANRATRSDWWVILSPAVVAGVVSLPWYAGKFLEVQAGTERDILSHLLTDVHQGRSFVEKLAFSYAILTAQLHHLVLASLGMVALGSTFVSGLARLNLLFATVTLIVWAALFGYDVRNLAVALPMWSLAFAWGLSALIERFRDWSGMRRPGWLGRLRKPELSGGSTSLIVIIGIVAFGVLLLSNDLEKRQSDQLSNRGVPQLNRFLSTWFGDSNVRPCVQCVLTNYRYMEAIPELNHLYLPQYRVVMKKTERPLWSLENFIEAIDEERLTYVLFSRTLLFSDRHERFVAFTRGLAARGHWEVVEDNRLFFFAQRLDSRDALDGP